ncbi:S-adenosyl-L-methionine-dependent methyltransferase [Piptocephalis cylindrospora]|uniref:tRNA N(3)-methylcytidine methyltransferase n=1 Tax=Piptocephalis cylindrospora TaxID=1907219 RepID=A0A4V1IY88_9FUNG|nr:S-adenosyl-L-methionine-dependent methyltransferase [Piptocephalis cylindrospora]|eukprot:RKP13709.1 S-adenosyl-L-methionine-dependent methyltransferase [Piptocephalis cylindrospora]
MSVNESKRSSSVVNAQDASSSSGNTESSADETFGSRQLTNPDEVFDHNAWDNVEWDSDQEKEAEAIVDRQRANPMPEEQQETISMDAALYWDRFYRVNQNRFFKDRNWLHLEFPELFEPTDQDRKEKKVIMEIGCGAGNTFFPLLSANPDPNLFAYCCDFSEEAVGVVKNNPAYNPERGEAFVWDLSSPSLPSQVKEGSVDVILLVFVLSALQPFEWEQAMKNLEHLLKPGGIILFRDYGRYDLAQLRFKSGRYLAEHFYARGDGTRVYFFSSDELTQVFGSRFDILQNAVDRRLIVNRSRRLKMYRVWLQGKFRKPLEGKKE